MEPSSMTELIARSSQLAYESGKDAERRRAIRILKALPKQFSDNAHVLRAVQRAIQELLDDERARNEKAD